MTVQSAIAELKKILEDRISTSKTDLNNHAGNETHFPKYLPDAVAWPASTNDVSKIAAICNAHACPVVAWGAGTSLEAHALAIRGGISLDFSMMNALLQVHTDDLDAVVQPGITRKTLNESLKNTGLFFPVDPGADASLGGMAATRASGTTTVRYGTMRDNVMALEVVLADGRIIRTGSRARKSAAGYDLTGLLVGSEGTLGIITELTLRLHGQPEAISAAICAFETIEDAVNVVITAVQSGIPLARIEFVDDITARAFNAYSSAEMPEKPHLLLEFHGSDQAVADDARRFGEIVADFGGSGFQWATHAEDRNALWRMRHLAYYAALSLKTGATAVVTDVCVPISQLATAVAETKVDIARTAIPGPIFGHVGDGNFHAILLVTPGNQNELDAALDLSKRMIERALALGGTATGEHGVGMGKLAFMAQEHGEGWAIMADLKRTLDPENILNPGKVVSVN